MRIKNEELISGRIKQILKDKKMSQIELARRIGTTQAALSQMLNGGKGYVLKEPIVKKICAELHLKYDELVSVRSPIDEHPLNPIDYERMLVKMNLDKYGVDITRVVVSGNKVYRCNKYTNGRYTCGGESYDREGMEERMKEDKKFAVENGLDVDVEEYYEIMYRDHYKRLSISDFETMIDNFNSMMRNSLDFIFAY